MGLVAQAQENHHEALEAFEESRQLFNELGARWEVARVLSETACSLFSLARESEADVNWRESLRLSLETHGLLTTMEALIGLAGVYARRGNSRAAYRLLLCSLNHPATLPETKNRAEKLAAECQENLTSQEIEAARISSAGPLEVVVREILT